MAFGIDVEAISRRDRAKSLRQLTAGLDFVTLAVADGWSLGGRGRIPTLTGWAPGPGSTAEPDEKRGVMIALIPGMGSGPDEMPILADDPSPAQIARRLKRLADALQLPWKINAGVTAVDLMLQTRTKTWSPESGRTSSSRHRPPTSRSGSATSNRTSTGPAHPPRRSPLPLRARLRPRRLLCRRYRRAGAPIGDPVHHPDGAPFDAVHTGLLACRDPRSLRLAAALCAKSARFEVHRCEMGVHPHPGACDRNGLPTDDPCKPGCGPGMAASSRLV